MLFTQAFEFAGSVHSALCASREFIHPNLEELLLREFQASIRRLKLLLVFINMSLQTETIG